ncbi:MAG: hypothetical protein CMG48_01620 [Candidatus Marinimicrobia bacterium]|nr:hypothetical protein [Candidatus Neomarinimicrobiota bacterium]
MSIKNQIKNLRNPKLSQNHVEKFINDLKDEIEIRKKRTTKRIVFSSVFIIFLLPIFSYITFLSDSNDIYLISEENSIEQKQDFNLDQHNLHFESIDYIIDNSDLIISDCVLSCDMAEEYNSCIVNFALGI